MEDEEFSALDELMLIASASLESEKTEKEAPNKLNEDELFLAKIASNDLKALKTPTRSSSCNSKSKKVLPLLSKQDLPSTSSETTSKNNSLIHSGDTDSSDDESNRDFQNSKYNEYGRQIKQLLPETKARSDFQQSVITNWKPKYETPVIQKKNQIPSKKFGGTPQIKIEENILKDPFFGIRISKPLISSAMLEERMNGRVAVSMFKVKSFVATIKPDQDWVIAGCIVQTSNTRVSQNGGQYIIWTLSDLQNDLQTVSLFLFRNAYKELWKTTVGTVVGVLNPSVLENRHGSKHQATLSVDNHQKVMIFGHAKDFGTCKSRKKDGEQCTSFVNTNRCSFCLYHVKQEYQKCSLRSDIQSRFSGKGLTALRNKVLGKNEVFYAGKSYMAIPAKQNAKLIEKDRQRLAQLKNMGVVTSPSIIKQKTGLAASLDVSCAQRLKDLQLLKKLKGSTGVLTDLDSKRVFNSENISAEVTLEESRQTALNVIAKLKSKNQIKPSDDLVKTNKIPKSNSTSINLSDPVKEFNIESIVDTTKLKMFKNLTAEPAPTLKQPKNSIVDLSAPISNRSKQKALQWVQKNGPIKKNNPSGTKKSGVKRFLETTQSPNSKKSKLDDEKAIFSDRFKKIMALTSAHNDLLEQHDLNQQEKYFNKLEQREQMEEKMMSTFKIKCKAVKCLNCKYTSFSAADRCKQERHVLKVFDSIKRFFKCGNCGNRTVALEVCPLFSCKQCGSSKWERTAMMKEKLAKIGETLSIRGGEQTFVNSVVSDANINLMVPDDL